MSKKKQAKQEAAEETIQSETVKSEENINLSEGEVKEEVIKELNISESDRHEFFIMRIIEKLGGVASIDKIIIGAYRDNKEILERQKLNAKLYRMSSKGLIYSHPNKKGVYSIKEVKVELDDSDWLEEL